MKLSDYVRIVRRTGWLVLLAMGLAAGSAFVFSKLQTPIYRSEQKILIQPARNDFGLTQTLVDLLNSYAQWMSTNTLAQQVIDTLHLDMTPDQLTADVLVSPDRNNDLLNVDVSMTDGNVANDVARTYGELFDQWLIKQNQPLQLADRINAVLLDKPRYGQSRPTTAVNVLAGALLGLLIGGAAVVAIETASANVVRRATDVERGLQLPVLGAIPDTAVKGAS
ncbi:MAG: YveK family protein [Aggregatilineales bacterium]